ncbi:conserved hypothetical protein [Thiomonas sp. X19]|uniref:glycine zipper 2TM domain-containing protein n=1 Tax=Thiomonas sp. X19 TaxID=1050370 RepID=UPI000B6C8B12|nr:glycine zipper 2TM domain-containing protein [Thiomonas sp. X19]SCC91959.1 conserved hypothetical protein [Thiomonas sp. X19]
MQTPTPPQPPTGSSAPKTVWIAAGVLGTLIVVLLAAVLYKLSAGPASPTAEPLAPTATASIPAGAIPAQAGGTGAQSAVAVTNAIPAATGASQFAPLQPSNSQSANSQSQRPNRVTQTQRQTQPVADRANNAAPQTFAPQTFAPQPGQAPAPAPQAPVCASCGTVVAVTPVQEPGHANGIGAVVGGVVGGLLGNQVGGGNGRTAATVIGALGGGYAGNEVQKRVNAQTVYRVQVRMDDGQVRTTTLGAAPPMGQRVQFGANGGLNPLP